MRVVSASHHAGFIGGGELSQLQLLQGLHLRGMDLTLAVPGAGWCADQAHRSGIAVVELPMPPIGEPETLSALREWYHYFRESSCDVLHANTSRAAFYAGITGRRLGIPVVFHCRIAERDWKLDWLIARLVARIVVNSRATGHRFSSRFADKVEVVYNGIEVPAVMPPHQPHSELDAERLLLCVARVSRWKRHDRVLEAFASLADRLPGLHLAMLGGDDPHDPAWMDELKGRTEKMACGARVHWLGQRDDMAAWYSAADALVLASREEPFGRVVVEAMAYGVPVVAMNAGGPAEIIEQGTSGMLVDEDTPEGWSGALWSVLEHGDFRDAVIAGGRKRAGEFSLAQHVARMETLFARVDEEGR